MSETTVIQVEHAMLRAWLEGISGYQPVFRGQKLEVENGSVEVSLKNLRTIVKSGKLVSSLLVAPSTNVLVTFLSGETYLATGLSVGHDGIEVKGLAEFASEVGLGNKKAIFRHISAFPKAYVGPIEFPVPGDVRVVH